MVEDYIIVEGRNSTLASKVDAKMKELQKKVPEKKYVLHGPPVKTSKTHDGLSTVLIQAIVSTSLLLPDE